MSQTSLLDNAFDQLRRTSIRDGFRILQSTSKDSLKSTKTGKKKATSYKPYSIYEQTMFPTILRDAEATNKLLEAILESPNGKRSLSRLARTCKAFSGPALNILWKELDSIVPIIGLFPGALLKKTRKPGLGLSRLPRDEDWNVVLKYNHRIHRITYDETANNMTPSIFSVFEECRPQNMPYILPRLQELTWKVETATALERSMIFIHPQLQVLNLDIGNKMPRINDFLTEISGRTMLKGLSFVSPTNLPDNFISILSRQVALEKITLVAPGALAPRVGRWAASLPELKQLQLDLTGRSPIAVEGFFDELHPRSGYSTPSSVASRDSGVFSGEELDFTEIRKSALRLTAVEHSSKGSFPKLKKVQLTGEIANISVFLKHLESDLVQLDLVIEDPPDNADWQDFSELMCEHFASTLQTLRISATAASRFADLVRSTSRAEPPSGRVSLEKFSDLRCLTRLEIDLPESIIFTPADIESLANACPNLEILKLCPTARFPVPHSPKLTLESLSPLISQCKRLHTLAVVFNAGPGSERLLRSQDNISHSILRLHVGHSWANDPLQISIILSHFTPKLELLKWFQEKNRAGFNEMHAKNWQTVSETLPHLQLLRATEKSFMPSPSEPPKQVETADKSIDATVRTVSRSISAQVSTSEMAIQSSPVLEERGVEAIIQLCEASIDATPVMEHVSIEAKPGTTSTGVTAAILANGNLDFSRTSNSETSSLFRPLPNLYIISSLFSLLSFAYRYAVLPISLTSRILQLAMARFHNGGNQEYASGAPKQTLLDTKLDTQVVREPSESISLSTLQRQFSNSATQVGQL